MDEYNVHKNIRTHTYNLLIAKFVFQTFYYAFVGNIISKAV